MSWLKRKLVLVPTDFSEQSYEAIAVAKEYVDDLASVKLVHVLSPLHPADPAAIWDTLSDSDRMAKVTEFLTKKLSEIGYDGVEVVTLMGDPGTQIADYAQESAADLIVMPSHGHKGITRLLMGSVAERVVRLATCPVLILK
ncbi:universal stress protein [Nodosilinea sp. LEGE 07088]|uniref:universal stress protein n=1 Tax=Nodosilinea sp. LEGE 07088 TaxID=2777968 RepID=UPI00187F5400|nr:universal stress protein [Nodosilinea sp. LEGE 07088]MBE9139621.1 universal stress protein [Nodosilinea sp. LEGE 07088]